MAGNASVGVYIKNIIEMVRGTWHVWENNNIREGNNVYVTFANLGCNNENCNVDIIEILIGSFEFFKEKLHCSSVSQRVKLYIRDDILIPV